MKKSGMTLIEIVIAAVIMIVLLGAFLSKITFFAKAGEDNEKVQMAIKILQSMKEEVLAVRFKDFVLYADKNTPDENNEYILDDMFYPQSKEQVMDYQKKYRDFEVGGTFKFVQRKNRDPKERSMLNGKLEVNWVQPSTGKQKRTLPFSVIDPKS